MITKRGSQNREPLKDTEYTIYMWLDDEHNEVILEYYDEYHFCQMYEVWFKNDHSASYVIEIDGSGIYEFARSYKKMQKLSPKALGKLQITLEYAEQIVSRINATHKDEVGHWTVLDDDFGVFITNAQRFFKSDLVSMQEEILLVNIECKEKQLIVKADSTYHPKSKNAYKEIKIDLWRSPDVIAREVYRRIIRPLVNKKI